MNIGLRLVLLTMAAVLLLHLLASQANASEEGLEILKQNLCSQAATEQVLRQLGTANNGAAEEMYADEFRVCMERMKDVPTVFS